MPRSYAHVAPTILMHNANAFGGGHYRILQPASLLRQHGYAIAQAHHQLLENGMLDVLRPDALVVQFQQTDAQIEALRRYRKVLKDTFFVYEIDDLFWQVPDTSIHKAGIAPDTKDRIKTAASICDAITVTTDALAKEMRRLTGMKDIRILPNEVPMHFINAALAGRRSATITSTKPRVGWAGGIGHTGDLQIVAEIMKILGDEVHWVFMGMTPPGVEQADVEYHPGVSFENYPAGLGALRLDIALAPLEDNNFNRCKSDLRLLEYGAAGFPTIASNIVTYQDCPYVHRLPNDAQAWADAIREMLADKPILEGYAESLHRWVVDTRCMDRNLEHRVKAYLPRNTVTFIPAAAPHGDFPGAVVTVGANLPGLQNFPTFTAAWEAAPGSNILYLRPDAAVNPLQFARILNALQPGSASISALTNDSVYPTPTAFSAMDPIAAQKLDMTAMVLDDEPVHIPCPTGPCILFARSALYRYGLPDDRAYVDLELAFMDWGARAAESGSQHTMVPNVYIHAGTRINRTKEAVEWAVNHVCAWMPQMSASLQNYVKTDPLAKVRENLELAFHRFHYDTPPVEGSYAGWVQVYDTIGTADVAAIRAETETWAYKPHINIVMPVFDPDPSALRAAIESVTDQAYGQWTLLIVDDASTNPIVRGVIESHQFHSQIKIHFRTENGHICQASNDALRMAEPGYDAPSWVVFLDHDDVLAPHALWMIAREIVTDNNLQFIYSDADKLKEDGTRDAPYFAPDFNYELLLASNYVTHLAAYRLDGIRAIGGLRPGYEGSQDWDLVLRYLADRCGTPPDRKLIRHIPRVLYHWRMSPNSTSANINAKPYALEAGRRAVLDHLQATGQTGAFVGPNPQAPVCVMVRFLISEPAPMVSIIIPTRDHDQVLSRCMGSLLARTLYPNYEVLIVDNGSKDPATLRLLTEAQKDKRVRVLRRPGPFNFSRMNNDAAREAKGEFLCLLNDDTEIVEPAWLNDLVGLAGRKDVGAVGAKLMYPNGTVQQNGIMIDWNARPGAKAMHVFQQLPVNHPGQASRNLITQEWTALTGACMVVRKRLYLEMDGLDEETFPIDYNDVDFCLRLYKQGYRNLVSAQAIVVHHEGATKKKHVKEHAFARVVADEARLMERHGDVHDGQWNRNLMFHPHLDKAASAAPAKPWSVDRQRVLIVNGTVEDAMRAWNEGKTPFCATLNGHHLHVTYPQLAHVRPIDVRGPIEPFVEILGALEIPQLDFCGVGNGTAGLIGFLAAVADVGWRVEYRPTMTAQAWDPYLGEDVWQLMMGKLAAAQKRSAEMVADGGAAAEVEDAVG